MSPATTSAGAGAGAGSCELALDANDILTALDEGIDGLDPLAADLHLVHCKACQNVARLRSTSRAAWTTTTALRESSREAVTGVVEANSDLRRMWEAGGSRRRPLALAPFVFATHRGFAVAMLALASIAIAATTFAIVHTRGERMQAVSTADTATERAVDHPDQPPSRVDESPSPPKTLPAPQKAATRSMIVPSGSKIMLGFSLAGATVSPGDGSAEIIGPATASATDTSLTLQRGMVKVNALRHVSLLLPGARLEPNGSTCTVQVDDQGVAHVNVDSGRAVITGRSPSGSTSPGVSVTIEAGGAMDLSPDGSLRIAPSTSASSALPAVTDVRSAALASSITRFSPPPPKPTPEASAVLQDALASEAAIANARTRLRNGETAAARADLERLSQSSDARLARRASFTLAEMDLAAGGDRSHGRSRLETLMTCPEPALGADAATLLARSMPSGAERAAVWKRYLATNPPHPYVERALLDRAEALLDAGNTRDARVILEEAKQSQNLTESQRRQLDRLLVKARDMR